jgi:hypothetical protein
MSGDVAIAPDGLWQALNLLSCASRSNSDVEWFDRGNARTTSTESKKLNPTNSTSSVFLVVFIRDSDSDSDSDSDGVRRLRSF